MIQRLQIENFRGLRHLDISSFKRVNLIAGANNVGKSALLEAIFFALHGKLNEVTDWFPRMLRPAPQDDDAAKQFWTWVFSDSDSSKPVHIRAEGDGLNHDRLIVAGDGASLPSGDTSLETFFPF